MIYQVAVIALVLASVARANTETPSAPRAKPPTEALFFYETFDEGDIFESGKWVKSENEKYAGQPLTVRPPTQVTKGFENDHGLSLSSGMKHYGFGAKFPQPIAVKDQDLVVQYELKLEETLACGGAYVKLLRDDGNGQNLASLNSATPYAIMFGPDKCGSSSNKVHFIVQHQNPISKEWEEKHFNETTTVKMDRKTHLYTLHLKKDNSFSVYVDKKVSKSGNLLTHMRPAINPPKEIDDPTDSKPADWVDEEMMDDPQAQKPDDWDEDAPKMIPDPKAKKPDAWLDDAPAKIPDPNAVKPADWDDEEDGTWEAPLIDNPDCATGGCGEWKPPLVKNPNYKGKWKRPKIPNPDYKGVWKARQIPNPTYFEDLNPVTSIAPMYGLAVEVWTTSAGIFFDNFVVGRSLEDAFAFADATYSAKVEAEKSKDKNPKKDKKKKDVKDKTTTNTASTPKTPQEKIQQIIDYVKENPWVGVSTVLAVILVMVLFGGNEKPRRSHAPPAPAPAPTPAPAASEQKDEAK